MFHVKPVEDIHRLRRLAAVIGVDVSIDQAELMIAHLDHVLRANVHLNLTSITDRRAAIRLHVVDSLAVLQELDGAASERLAIDLGSGAGFPGIPLGIAMEAPVVLLEPRKRRAEFLTSTVADLELAKIEVAAVRAEDYAAINPGQARTVVARAVAPLSALVELAQPLMIPVEGRFVAMKGQLGDEELSRGDAAAALVGMERLKVTELLLPEGGETRTLVTYSRVGDSTIRLPRRAGLAQKRPLA